jgi:hypothetical protein
MVPARAPGREKTRGGLGLLAREAVYRQSVRYSLADQVKSSPGCSGTASRDSQIDRQIDRPMPISGPPGALPHDGRLRDKSLQILLSNADG